MSSNSPKFMCTSCGKEFRWKPEIAGRKAKCKCGQTLTVPSAPPAPKAAPAPKVAARAAEPNPLEWPDEPAADYSEVPPPPAPSGAACPSCGAGLAANAVLCVNCGYNLKTGKKIGGVASAAPAASTSLTAPAPAGGPAPGGPGAAYAGTYHRAKIDQVTTVEEETSSWQGYLTILAGVGALGLGVWQLLDPHDPGDPNIGRRRGRWFRQLIRWLHDLGGTAAVVGAFTLVGLGLIAYGVLQVRKKIPGGHE